MNTLSQLPKIICKIITISPAHPILKFVNPLKIQVVIFAKKPTIKLSEKEGIEELFLSDPARLRNLDGFRKDSIVKNFFIGLDSVASHIAASVDKESITLFGPSNPINWKPWSDKAQIISRKELNLIEVEEVMTLVGKMTLK